MYAMLKINKNVEYAILSLEAIDRSECAASARSIADLCSLPFDNLSKILQRLAQSGLIEAIRGPKGGYVLKRDFKKISLTEVMNAVGETIDVVPCLTDNRACSREEACTMREGFKHVQQTLVRVFESIGLEDLRTSGRLEDVRRI